MVILPHRRKAFRASGEETDYYWMLYPDVTSPSGNYVTLGAYDGGELEGAGVQIRYYQYNEITGWTSVERRRHWYEVYRSGSVIASYTTTTNIDGGAAGISSVEARSAEGFTALSGAFDSVKVNIRSISGTGTILRCKIFQKLINNTTIQPDPDNDELIATSGTLNVSSIGTATFTF